MIRAPARPIRAIRTWRQGEVGMGATRRVLPGGLVVVGGSRGSKMWRRELRSDALLPFVGEVIYAEDIDDSRGWHLSTCEWLANGRVCAGRLIAIAEPVIRAELRRQADVIDAPSSRIRRGS